MIVREATAKDIPSLLDFQLKMALETENITLEIDMLTRGVHRVFKDPSKGNYYVVEANDEIIGCLMTTYEWSDWRVTERYCGYNPYMFQKNTVARVSLE